MTEEESDAEDDSNAHKGDPSPPQAPATAASAVPAASAVSAAPEATDKVESDLHACEIVFKGGYLNLPEHRTNHFCLIYFS